MNITFTDIDSAIQEAAWLAREEKKNSCSCTTRSHNDCSPQSRCIKEY